MRNKLNNQGFILMASLMVATVAIVLSGAYVSSALVQSNSARKMLTDTQEFYATEAGMAYGFVEAKSADTETHDLLAGGSLQAKASGAALKFSTSGASIAGDGSYLAPGGKVKVKIYHKGADSVILAQAVVNGVLKGPVHKLVISTLSLYKYFQFYDNGSSPPNFQWDSGGGLYSGKRLDSKKVGGIHVNGDIVLAGAGFVNLSELSASGQFYYLHSMMFHEPAGMDISTWDAVDKRITTHTNQSSCGVGGCYIDGRAPINRYSLAPYNFKPPWEDGVNIDVLSGFLDPSLLTYGNDVTDDWDDPDTSPTTYGWSWFWNKEYDANNNNVIDEAEKKRIPKILPVCKNNSSCFNSRDKYWNLPGDNMVSWYSWPQYLSYKLGSNLFCGELPVRYEVTNSSYNYEALRWLLGKEEGANEYVYTDQSDVNNRWLKTAATTGSVSNDVRWNANEYDRVTLLSLMNESGIGGLNLGGGSGLDGSNEYQLYRAVSQYQSNGTFPGGTSINIQNWITNAINGLTSYNTAGDPTVGGWNSSDRRDKFFYWWKRRSFHHNIALVPGGLNFPGDTATVPAWERLFWEAWFNYWPPQTSGGRSAKTHKEAYSPAEGVHAINPEWWIDLVFGSSRPASGADESIDVTYLDTSSLVQADAFADWLALPQRSLYNSSDPSQGQVRFDAPTLAKPSDHGGEIITPLNIKSRYSALAQANGLSIVEEGGNFKIYLNGLGGAYATLASGLAALPSNVSDSWIYAKTFYNPYTIVRGTYDPGKKDQDITDNNSALYINPCSPVYGTTSCAANIPPTVKVIEIDLSRVRSKNIAINNHIIYIDSPNYDVRLINGATLPAGGFSLVTPYDVYIKAQRLSEADLGPSGNFDNDASYGEANAYRSCFNHENSDKTTASGGADTNVQPAAVITNSRVYYLSSEFQDSSLVFPYSYNFPDYGASLRTASFLQVYCWPVWPSTYPKPSTQGEATWAWVRTYLSSSQQENLLNLGNTQYKSVFAGNNMVNLVKYDQFFNLAVGSPQDQRGYRLERWRNSLNTADVSINLEGAFIKIGYWKQDAGNDAYLPCDSGSGGWCFNLPGYTKMGDNQPTYLHARYHSPVNTIVNWYETSASRFSITGCNTCYYWRAERIDMSSRNVSYEYEERFWSPSGRPAGDFLASGSEQKWVVINPTGSNPQPFNNDTPEIVS